MEGSRSELELEGFLKQMADQFQNLSSVNSSEILSLSWVRRLLDAFLCCQEHIHVILLNSKTLLSKPPWDHLVFGFFDRSIKALDICNSIQDGVQKIRQWQKHLEIVLSAFDSGHKSLNEGKFKRAMRAFSVIMWGEREASSGVLVQRNWSFRRTKEGGPSDRFWSLMVYLQVLVYCKATSSDWEQFESAQGAMRLVSHGDWLLHFCHELDSFVRDVAIFRLVTSIKLSLVELEVQHWDHNLLSRH